MNRYAVAVANLADMNMKISIVSASSHFEATKMHPSFEGCVIKDQDDLDDLCARADLIASAELIPEN